MKRKTWLGILMVLFLISGMRMDCWADDQTAVQEADVIKIIQEFKRTTNEAVTDDQVASERAKKEHFNLFAEDAKLIVVPRRGNKTTMDGIDAIIRGTPWTGTTINFPKITIQELGKEEAKLKTEAVLLKGSKKRKGSFDWTFVLQEGEWKIKRLQMNLR